jgi:hypothetical protein
MVPISSIAVSCRNIKPTVCLPQSLRVQRREEIATSSFCAIAVSLYCITIILFDGTSYVTPTHFYRFIRPNPVYLCSYDRLQRLFCYVLLCVAEYGTGLATKKELGSMDSLNTTGQVPLTGDFSLMQLYLPFIVVVLAIVSLSIDSLNTTGQKPLTGDSSLTRLSLYYLRTVEGSFRGRSGIWKFQGSGFPPLLKRVFFNPRTKQHNTHTSHRAKSDASISNSLPSTTRLNQQSTRYRGCRKHPSPESIVGSGRDWIPAEMGKRGGWTTTKQRAESIKAVSWETQDPMTGTYLRHGIDVFQRAPKYHAPGLTLPQFLRDNNALFGIVETVSNVGFGIQMFNSPIRKHGVFDGIRMYIRVVNTSGPTVRIPKWIHEQGWIRGLVHRYITAYGEIPVATLDV